MDEKILSVILILVLIIIFFGSVSCRESEKWEENVKLQNGKIIEVHYYFSKIRYYGARHGFGFGGGDPRHKIWFEYEGRKYKWDRKYMPILLNYDNGIIYLVISYWDGSFGKIGFRLYKFKDDWEEISEKDFPRNIAVQNLNLKKNIGYYKGKPLSEYKVVQEREPKDYLFQKSKTAKLWLWLENRDKYFEYSDSDPIDESFLAEYKRKYIKKKRN